MVRRRSDLPRDIVESILLKLPVKPLLRFKSVSKSWNSIISHPLFVRNHLSWNLFVRTRNSDTPDLCLVKLEDGKLQNIKIIQTPLIKPPWWGHRVCFSEYGMLLITNNWYFDTCILWNPCTRTTRKLSFPYNLYTCCSGICYDPAVDDFKVVAVYCDFYAVYSCKNESWSIRKQHPHGISFSQPSENSSGVCVNGAIYWLLRCVENNCAEIIYYDPRDDNLKILLKPNDVRGDKEGYLLYCGGHLCMFYDYGTTMIRIWRKAKGIDNDSWKELIAIRNVERRAWSLEPLCFMGNKIVMQYKDSDRLWVYNPVDKTFERVEERLIGIGSLIPYRETLYILT